MSVDDPVECFTVVVTEEDDRGVVIDGDFVRRPIHDWTRQANINYVRVAERVLGRCDLLHYPLQDLHHRLLDW